MLGLHELAGLTPLSPSERRGASHQMTPHKVNKMAQPLKRIRAGSVSASIWENEIRVNGSAKTILKASVERRYKDKDGSWKSTSSFGRNEIPLAVYCLEQAFEAIIEEEKAENGNGSNGAAEEVVE